MWRLLMVAAVAISFCAPAGAMPVTYAWTGTVTENNSGFPGVSVGETIPISLTLNNAVANQSATPDVGVYSSAFGVPPLILAVNIGGVTIAGSFQTVDVSDNHMGIDEFLISTGTPLTGCCFTILFETSHVGVLTSNAIPLLIDPTKFEIATFSEHLFPSVGGSFSGTIDSAVSVPEPAARMLFGTGLLAIIFLRFGPLGWVTLGRRVGYCCTRPSGN